MWSKTALLINFDENDGYFDHMPSPSAPSRLKNGQYAGKSTLSSVDMQDEYFDHAAPEGSHSQPTPDGRVYGPGPRVPLYVISPWSRGGWVNSQVLIILPCSCFRKTFWCKRAEYQPIPSCGVW